LLKEQIIKQQNIDQSKKLDAKNDQEKNTDIQNQKKKKLIIILTIIFVILLGVGFYIYL